MARDPSDRRGDRGAATPWTRRVGSWLLTALAWVAAIGAAGLAAGLAAYVGFSLFVKSGVTQVPLVEGLSREAAAALLIDSGLDMRLAEEEGRYDDTVPAGRVLRQRPRGSSLVKRGTDVELLLSLGPQLVEVPDVRGRALAAAQVVLGAAGLSAGDTSRVYTAQGEPGTVAEQWPLPGALVGRSDEIELYLAIENVAEVFVMPDLVYRDHARVRSFFEQRGFRLGSVKFEPYENVAPGIVLRQFPLPGHPLGRRDVISLVVSSDGVEG